MIKTVLLIDGGYLRASSQKSGKAYNSQFVDAFSTHCFDSAEYIFRILYYDAPQFTGTVPLPVSSGKKTFTSTDSLLNDLAKLERFACRQGSLGFRGWKPREIPIKGDKPLMDSDFAPIFEQKGVDMRVGLDIAEFSTRRSVDRILLVSGDTDMIPAMKLARKSGLEIGIIQLPPPTRGLHDSLLTHSDFTRSAKLP